LSRINKDLNETKQSFGNNKENIGNYTESINKSNISNAQFVDTLGEMPGSAGQAGQAVKGLGDNFKALLKNPIVLLIAGIVAGLVMLGKAFTQSASGSRTMAKAMAGLEGAFGAIIKLVEPLGKFIEKAFKDPQKAVEDLWEVIKQNLINRVMAVPAIFEALGRGIVAQFKVMGAGIRVALANVPIIGEAIDGEKATKDLKNALSELADSAIDTGQAFIQMQTGITAEQFEGIGEVLTETAKQAALFAEAMIKLNEAQFVSRQNARFLQKDIAVLNAELELLTATADDSTLSMTENKDAVIEAGKVAVKVAQQEKALAGARLGIINQELALRRSFGEDVQDLLDQQLEAQISLLDAENKAVETERALGQKQREIQRDITEQRLDILIDGADKIKTINENIITNEDLTLEKRRSVIKETEDLLTGSYQAQLNEVKGYVNDYEGLQDLINETDAVQLQKKIEGLGANEIISNRILEIVKERQQAERDFAEIAENLDREERERKKDAVADIKDLELQKTEFLTQEQIKRLQNQEGTDDEILRLQNELNAKLIQAEKDKLAIELADKRLTAEERTALELETELAILKIKTDADVADAERQQKGIELLTENLATITDLTREFAGAQGAIFGEISNGIFQSFEDGKVSVEEGLQVLGSASTAIFDAQEEKRNEQMNNNELRREAELELVEGDIDAQKAINDKYDKEQAKIKLKQFNADKASALVQIAIQTALAVMQSLASIPPPASFITAGIVGGVGAVQAGIVASKSPPKFALGTNDIVNIGGSHASGQDVTVVGYDNAGNSQVFGKVERGEAMPVIRKSAINEYRVSQLNGKYQGTADRPTARKFATGTNDITTTGASEGGRNFPTASEFANEISKLKLNVKVEDITSAQNDKAEILDNSQI
jgi:hypothetical protein